MKNSILQFEIRMLAIVLVIAGIFASCQGAESMYSGFSARFTYQPVSAKPTLFRACTSLGEYCTITLPLKATSYVISSPSTPNNVDNIPLTAIQSYAKPILGLGDGLIVGLPMIPEMLESESKVVCYDLCCSNCNEKDYIRRKLQLQIGGIATCSSCKRIYDLNNQGMVTQGEYGRSLYRYYVYYEPSSQRLTVNNN